jgi:hypothetical protein
MYRYLANLFGEPEDLWTFDPLEVPQPNPLRLCFVPAWPARGPDETTEFNTLGMSEDPMPGTERFAELHYSHRGVMDKDQRLEVARFLANLALYPFYHGLALGPWEVIPEPGRIPGRSGCRHVLLCPQTAPGEIEALATPYGDVQLLFVIPITPAERQILRSGGRAAFAEYVLNAGVDLLSDRVGSEAE